MTDEQLIHSCPVLSSTEVLERYSPAGTLGLCLPMTKRLSIKQSWILEAEFLENPMAQFTRMIDELTPDCPESKSTLIVFVANPDGLFTFRDPDLAAMLNMVRTR